MIPLLLVLVSAIPCEDVLRERCDVIEVNHFWEPVSEVYDADYPLAHKFRFSQFLFWDWRDGDLQLRDWRMAQGSKQRHDLFPLADGRTVAIPAGELPRSEAVPRYDHRTRLWELRLRDGDALRVITAPVLRETWTAYDPEQLIATAQPKCERRELRARPDYWPK